jgi:sulfotransferase
MWNTQQAFDCQAIPANRRQQHAHQMIAELPSRYYSNTNRPIVIDKGRTWTLPLNVEMLRKYVTPQPKIICLRRDPSEVIQSFRNLFHRNNRTDFDSLGVVDTFNYSLAGLHFAEQADDPDTFLFVDFNDLISEPETELLRIYDFLGLEAFTHNLNNIVNQNQEDDSVYGLIGMHDIRSSICPIPNG